MLMMTTLLSLFQDTRLRGFHGLNSALLRGASLLADQNLSQLTPAERSLKLERRNVDLDSEKIPSVWTETRQAPPPVDAD